jgi:hypothetical protein
MVRSEFDNQLDDRMTPVETNGQKMPEMPILDFGLMIGAHDRNTWEALELLFAKHANGKHSADATEPK